MDRFERAGEGRLCVLPQDDGGARRYRTAPERSRAELVARELQRRISRALYREALEVARSMAVAVRDRMRRP